MKCFVIGPIGDQLADAGTADRIAFEESVQIFEEVIKAACDAFEIEAYRSDEIDDPGEIPEQIFEALRDEDLVIADLTGANPNVMYELGIRHVTGKCTIQIGEKGKLPFDVNTIRTVQFVRSASGLVAARKKLQRLIGSSLANGCHPSVAARVLGVAAADSGAGSPGSSRGDDNSDDGYGAEGSLTGESDGDETGPLGLLDAIVDLESNVPEMTVLMETQTRLTTNIGALTAEYNDKLARVSKPTQALALLRRFSADLEPLVRSYDEGSIELHTKVITVGYAVNGLLSGSAPAVDNQEEMLHAIVGMGHAAQEARTDGLEGYLESVASLRDISRDLRPVVRLLQSALERTIDDFISVEEWGRAAARCLAGSP